MNVRVIYCGLSHQPSGSTPFSRAPSFTSHSLIQPLSYCAVVDVVPTSSSSAEPLLDAHSHTGTPSSPAHRTSPCSTSSPVFSSTPCSTSSTTHATAVLYLIPFSANVPCSSSTLLACSSDIPCSFIKSCSLNIAPVLLHPLLSFTSCSSYIQCFTLSVAHQTSNMLNFVPCPTSSLSSNLPCRSTRLISSNHP